MIESESDYQIALAKIEELLHPRNDEELADLYYWMNMAEAYEAQHFPIPKPSPEAAFAFRVEQGGHSL